MPHYSYQHTFQPGTTRDTEDELEMPCHWGILTDVTVSFLSGCRRKVHVHIDEALHQIFPTNPDADYAFDFYTLVVTDEYELLPGVRKIYLRGWNEGSYAHTIAVAFRVKMPERLTTAEKALWRLVEIWEAVIYGKGGGK